MRDDKDKKPALSIDAHLYNPRRTERKYHADLEYLRMKTGRLHAKTSLRHKFRELNQPGGMFNLSGGGFSPGVKVWALLFIALAIGIGGFAWAEQPGNGLFHSVHTVTCTRTFMEILENRPCNDPVTSLWNPSASANVFQHNALSTYSGGCSCDTLQSNSTFTAIALTSNPVGELSLANGKELSGGLEYTWFGTNCCQMASFGWYLTTNNTLPKNTAYGLSYYDPLKDPNVVMALQANPTSNVGNGTASFFLYMLKPQQGSSATLSSENTGDCSSGGSCMMTVPSATLGLKLGLHGLLLLNALNYTGTGVNTSNAGASLLEVGDTNVATFGQSNVFPWLTLSNGNYYLGAYMTPQATGAAVIGIQYNQAGVIAPSFSVFTPTPATTQPSPTIDTGGFFGPIIKALISIGVFILSNILAFASFLWNSGIQPAFAAVLNFLAPALATLVTIILNVIKTVLDAIGNALGLGAIGTNLFSFASSIAAFFTSVFGDATGQLSSFISFLNNGYLAISSTFSTYWTDLGNWVSGIKDFIAGLWPIATQMFSIGFAFMFSGWLLYGAKRFSDSVGDGMEWFNLTRQWILLGVAITLFFLTIITHYVLIPAFHMIQSVGEAKKTAEPDIEIGGTGVG